MVDGEKPTLAQPADIVKNTDPGKNTAVVTFPLPAAHDNCLGVTVACLPASGFAFSIGVSTVTCTATDTSNNKTNVTFKVTVKDGEPPKIVCPDMIVTTNDVGLCSAAVRFTVTVTDNAAGVSAACVPPSGSAFPDGSSFVKCTATDLAGNASSCSFEVVVVDVEPPSLVQPADLTVSTDAGKTTAVVNFPMPPGADNCPGVTVTTAPPSGSVFPLGEKTVVATATDTFGNTRTVDFKVTVKDTEPPKIVCPDRIVKTNDTGLCSAVVRFTITVTDNAPGVSVTCVPPSGSAFPDGSTLVKCTATDTAANISSCSFEVVVVDVEPPSLVRPADLVVSTDPGKATALVNFPLPPGADNCPGVTITTTPRPGSIFPLGVNTVRATATDTFGNTRTVDFKVTVKDTEKPHITCPLPIITSTTPGQCSAKVNFSATATDNAPGVKLACLPPSGSIFPKGTTPVQCTATDTSGNTDTCSFAVTVNDTEKPVITVPPGVTVNADSNRCDAVVTFSVTATDNCPGVTVACVPPAGSIFPVGTTQIQCTATDTSGNTASSSFGVTVLSRAASSFSLTKTPNKPVANPGDPITFTYRVTNGGCEPLTQIDIVDDNATPDFDGDDFVVANSVSLAPGEVKTFTKTVVPPVQLCASTSPNAAMGQLIATELQPSGDIKVTLIQSAKVNDNTYGTNAVGWGATGHAFSDLLNGDGAVFSFTDTRGIVVLQFKLDYLSASTAFPSGSGSLGVSGGDGLVLVGSAANIASYSTSLAENLNRAPFLNKLAYYTVHSPAPSDPNSRLWEYRNIYTVVVKKAAFAAAGFGKVSVGDLINAPAKTGFQCVPGDDSKNPDDDNKNQVKCPSPVECNSVSTNTAVATARSGSHVLTTFAKAVVRIGDTCSTCSLDYPYASSNPRTSIAFNESEVLRGYSPQIAKRGDKIRVWYNDEHALALGIRQVIVKTRNGTITSNYTVTPLTTNPGGVVRPQVGTRSLTGDQAGTDPSGRPIHPALFITDITNDPSNKADDWQFGGTAIAPHAVYGTWKAGVRTVDKTRTPELVTVNLDNDPAKNDWNLGAGGPVPPGLKNQGYGAEVQWNVDELGLKTGHTYRFYFMVHDGDQNKTGGDAGHACLNVCFIQ